MMGGVDRLLSVEPPGLIAGADDGIPVIGLGLTGRRDEARRSLVEMRQSSRIPLFQSWIDYLIAWVDRRSGDMHALRAGLGPFKIYDDPEAIFQEGWLLCDLGEYDSGIAHLRRAVAKGYFVAPTLAGRPQFDALGPTPSSRRCWKRLRPVASARWLHSGMRVGNACSVADRFRLHGR